MKATYAYTLHRIAELTEHHWVRKLQRQVPALALSFVGLFNMFAR